MMYLLDNVLATLASTFSLDGQGRSCPIRTIDWPGEFMNGMGNSSNFMQLFKHSALEVFAH